MSATRRTQIEAITISHLGGDRKPARTRTQDRVWRQAQAAKSSLAKILRDLEDRNRKCRARRRRE